MTDVQLQALCDNALARILFSIERNVILHTGSMRSRALIAYVRNDKRHHFALKRYHHATFLTRLMINRRMHSASLRAASTT